MRVSNLVGSLARAGGHLRVTADGGLEYVGPPNVLTDDLRSEIRNRKDSIVAWLRTPIDDQPREDQLALDYERTLPAWVIERIHEAWER